MRGVSSMMMSVWSTSRSLAANSARITGRFNRPGNPRIDLRSVSLSRPASRFDSPSRNRKRVVTLRETNPGMVVPATVTSPPRALFSTVTPKAAGLTVSVPWLRTTV